MAHIRRRLPVHLAAAFEKRRRERALLGGVQPDQRAARCVGAGQLIEQPSGRRIAGRADDGNLAGVRQVAFERREPVAEGHGGGAKAPRDRAEQRGAPAGVLLVAREGREARQGLGGGGAAAGHGVVEHVPRPHDERLVVGAHVVEPAGRLVPEKPEHLVGELLGRPEPAVGEGRLVEGEQSVDEAGVVLEVAVQVRGAVLPRAEKTAVGVQRLKHEGRVELRGLAVAWLAERARRLGQRPQRQAVPRGGHLVVGGRWHAGRALLEQAGAHRPEALEERVAGEPERAPRGLGAVGHVQYVAPLEVAGPTHAVVAVEDRRVGLAERGLDLPLLPHVVLPLHALAVGVLGGEEAPQGVAEVAEQVVEGFLHDGPERFVPGEPVSMEIGAGELSVVVEHLLEVRDPPRRVGGVAGEAAAQVVVDAALRHGAQRVLHHVAGAWLAGPGVEPQQELQHHGLGEFRCAAEPAVLLVEA